MVDVIDLAGDYYRCLRGGLGSDLFTGGLSRGLIDGRGLFC